MWEVYKHTLQMVEGDFGLALPFDVKGTTITANDVLRFTFKDKLNGETLLTKEYTNIQQNSASLEFTENESALFPVGDYVYSLDWYQDGVFMGNLVKCAAFKVVEKA